MYIFEFPEKLSCYGNSYGYVIVSRTPRWKALAGYSWIPTKTLILLELVEILIWKTTEFCIFNSLKRVTKSVMEISKGKHKGSYGNVEFWKFQHCFHCPVGSSNGFQVPRCKNHGKNPQNSVVNSLFLFQTDRTSKNARVHFRALKQSWFLRKLWQKTSKNISGLYRVWLGALLVKFQLRIRNFRVLTYDRWFTPSS